MRTPRLQAFEFSDLPWWPGFLRRLLTDFLQTYTRLVKPFDRKTDLIVRATEVSGSNRIVDLCSGAGGPWLDLGNQLARESGKTYDVLLTDKFPNRSAAQRFERVLGIHYHAEPIDARAVPARLAGTRTLFDGFHHFPPEQALEILENAVAHGQPIVVFEILRRTVGDLIPMLFAWVHTLLLTPWIRPFSVARLCLTYIIPLAPLLITWDGSISVLRCYTPAELLEMAGSVKGGQDYHWEAGEYKKAMVFPVTYLVGYPKTLR